MTLSSALARAGRGVLAGALLLASPLAGQGPDAFSAPRKCRAPPPSSKGVAREAEVLGET